MVPENVGSPDKLTVFACLRKNLPKGIDVGAQCGDAVQCGHKCVRVGQRIRVMILPLWNEKRYRPYKVAALVEVLHEQGIPPEASLSGSGLSPESLTQPDTLTSIRQYITV